MVVDILISYVAYVFRVFVKRLSSFLVLEHLTIALKGNYIYDVE